MLLSPSMSMVLEYVIKLASIKDAIDIWLIITVDSWQVLLPNLKNVVLIKT